MGLTAAEGRLNRGRRYTTALRLPRDAGPWHRVVVAPNQLRDPKQKPMADWSTARLLMLTAPHAPGSPFRIGPMEWVPLPTAQATPPTAAREAR